MTDKCGAQIMPKKQIEWLNPELLRQSTNLTDAYVKMYGDWPLSDSLMKMIRHAVKINAVDDADKQNQDVAQVIMICLMIFDRKGMTAKDVNKVMTLAMNYANAVLDERVKDNGGMA